MNIFWIIPILVGLLCISLPNVYAETMIKNLEGGMDVEITYPEDIIVGREGTISILIKNNGWEEKQNISLVFSDQDNILITNPKDSIIIDRLAQDGSYGINVDIVISNNTNPGIHFLNLSYSQILVANNETPMPETFHDIAIPITIKDDPNIVIHTTTPESIFSNAEFPIDVEIRSEDIDIENVSIRIIPPKDIEFRGETQHTFSKIESKTPVKITSQIITPKEEINSEYNLPFEIIVTYTNDIGIEKEDSQTVSIILRPRMFMEITTDGGIWIGNFFIAPYVSLGTIIGIPAGAIISLLIRRNQNYSKKRPRKKKPKN